MIFIICIIFREFSQYRKACFENWRNGGTGFFDDVENDQIGGDTSEDSDESSEEEEEVENDAMIVNNESDEEDLEIVAEYYPILNISYTINVFFEYVGGK